MSHSQFQSTEQSYLVIAFDEEHQPLFSGAVVCRLDSVRSYAEQLLKMHSEFALVQIFDLAQTKAEFPVREPIDQISLPWG